MNTSQKWIVAVYALFAVGVSVHYLITSRQQNAKWAMVRESFNGGFGNGEQ